MADEFRDRVLEGEKIEDLLHGRLKIIQKEKGYRFSVDPLLLTNFAKGDGAKRIIDLGTGSGVMPLILADRTEAEQIIGIDIQAEMVDMARRSVKINSLEDRIQIEQCDLKKTGKKFKAEDFDVVISNPPYIPIKAGKLNPQKDKAIARHELMMDLEDLAKVSHYLLKAKGRAYLVYPASRTIDLLVTLRENGLEPKEIKFVHSNENSSAKLTLIKAVKDAGPEVTIRKPLYIYNLEGDYTDEASGILENGRDTI